ncbi:MAG: Holliday junction branch migration protein RuvA [Eubacteriales bacterium]|nr:Holliday junction branch migration protein RuvA [Eubacteriales bacterium]
MIYYIKGHVTYKTERSVIIENGSGIGFEIQVPAGSRLYLAGPEEEVTCFTEMVVREDSMSLYGFDDRMSLELFRRLVTVNGVGSKAAIAILSALTPQELRQAITYEDAAMLTRANGVGKKTAQRIVLDLKDKLGTLGEEGAPAPQAAAAVDPSGHAARAEALDALVALGYSMSEAQGALAGVAGSDLTAEAYIKEALKNM